MWAKVLLISFDCEVLNVLFCHTVDVTSIFFFSIIYSSCTIFFFSSRVGVSFSLQRSSNISSVNKWNYPCIHFRSSLVVIIVHNDSLASRWKCFYLMFYSIQFHFFSSLALTPLFVLAFVPDGQIDCGCVCDKLLQRFFVCNNQCNTACL